MVSAGSQWPTLLVDVAERTAQCSDGECQNCMAESSGASECHL